MLSPPANDSLLHGGEDAPSQAWIAHFEDVANAASNAAPAAQPVIVPPLYVDGADGTERMVVFRTAGVARWSIGASNEAESGGPGGSKLLIRQYDAAGVVPTIVMQIDRQSGTITMVNPVLFTPAALDNVTGSTAGNVALERLLQVLARKGLITNSTT